jgi:hypothetical protein
MQKLALGTNVDSGGIQRGSDQARACGSISERLFAIHQWLRVQRRFHWTRSV